MGFGHGSPVWSIVSGSPNTFTKLFDVYMTNVNSWTWAQSGYQPTTTTSVLNFANHSADYATSDAHISIAPNTIGGYLFDV